jgi:hypothetical protein
MHVRYMFTPHLQDEVLHNLPFLKPCSIWFAPKIDCQAKHRITQPSCRLINTIMYVRYIFTPRHHTAFRMLRLHHAYQLGMTDGHPPHGLYTNRQFLPSLSRLQLPPITSHQLSCSTLPIFRFPCSPSASSIITFYMRVNLIRVFRRLYGLLFLP